MSLWMFLICVIVVVVVVMYMRSSSRSDNVTTFTTSAKIDPATANQVPQHSETVSAVMPTNDNPFGNTLPKIEDNVTTKQEGGSKQRYPGVTTRKLYYENIYRPLEDYFDTSTSFRQYYSTPSKTQDIDNFYSFLYGDMTSCKANRLSCEPYFEARTDVRSLLRRTYPALDPVVEDDNGDLD